MIQHLSKIDLEQLEALIDKSSLGEVIAGLTAIAYEKASFVQETWEDKPLAKMWERNAKRLETVVTKLER